MKKLLSLVSAVIVALLGSGQTFAQWSPKNSRTTQDLTAVRFIDASTGFACGGYNTVVKTTDGGFSWQVLGSGAITPASYMSLDALSSSKIFVARNGVFVTEDGGATWTEWGLLNNSAYSIQSIKAINDSTAFITKGGYIFKTTNKGALWQAMYFDTDLGGPMQFTGSNDTAYAASGKTHDGISYGTIHKSTDGGANWTDLRLTSAQITAMYFRTGSIGYYAAFGNTLHKTSDGGLNWQAMNTPISAIDDYITGIYFSDDKAGYFITANGFIYKTTDGGASWKTEYSGHRTGGAYDVPLTAITAVGNNVLVVGNKGIILKNDGPLSVPVPEKSNVRMYPNPVINYLTVDLGQTSEYERLSIYDAWGRILCTRDINRQQKIVLDLQAYGQGFYLISLRGASPEFHAQVVVQ